ncbi:hypothetical protein O988_06107 [Pseudogymnoascus sp. VKM F-3808]|nr:hypothetical protein O988_06107 [Pseudogymnoascus sp. VKM F-3808]
MSNKVLFEAAVAPRSTEYYGTIEITNIRFKDGPVNIERFLGISFKSPASISSQDISTSPNPWTEVLPEATSEQIDASTFKIVARLSVYAPHTFNSLTVNIGVNGDLTHDGDRFVESVAIAVDSIPE